jgi:lipopolysaccharide export system permease protein
MDLENGEIHESEAGNTNLYRKLMFNKHRITMNAEQFSFQQSTPGGPRGDRELSTNDMLFIVDSLRIIREDYLKGYLNETSRYMFTDTAAVTSLQRRNATAKEMLLTRALEKVKSSKNTIISNYQRVNYIQEEINKYWVEIHKKYSIPAACIIFVLLGAPLGIMVRKGGFGVAASISLFFFLIYWAFLIGGEKLADRSIVSPFIGMWAANFLLGAAGIFLTIRTAKETVTIKFTLLKRLVPKQWRTEEVSEEQDQY